MSVVISEIVAAMSPTKEFNPYGSVLPVWSVRARRVLNRAVAVGHELQVQNADKSVTISSNIVLKTPEQIVFGRYNTPSNSAFVVAAGSSSNTLNLLEINKDGSIKNTHIQTFEQRISQLENQLTQALSSCREPSCDSIKTAYITSGSCSVEHDLE